MRRVKESRIFVFHVRPFRLALPNSPARSLAAPLTPPFSSADDEFPISKCVIRWTSWGLTAAIRKNNITVLTRAQFGISIESGAERVRTRKNSAERTFDRSAAEQHLLCFFSVRSGARADLGLRAPKNDTTRACCPHMIPPRLGAHTQPKMSGRAPLR